MSRLRVAARAVLLPAVVGGIVFASAGRWDLPFVWGVLACLAGCYAAMAASADPGLLAERLEPGPGERDPWTRRVGGPLLLAHWALAGLDAGRLGWSPVPWQVQAGGLAVFALALCVNVWAVRVNRFYSSAVRVQADRGQRVVDTGPYAVVRHPGYAATLTASVGGGLALGSWLAMVPLLAFTGIFLRRALFEDALLRRELPGYGEYAARVRSMLIPGVF